jgi:hypothetical protein
MLASRWNLSPPVPRMLTSRWKPIATGASHAGEQMEPIATGASYADEQMEAYRHRCLVCWRADGSLSPPVPRMLASSWNLSPPVPRMLASSWKPIATGASYAGEQMEAYHNDYREV